MPTVKIHTPGVSIELDEASITELGKQAIDLYRQASSIDSTRKPGPAIGFTAERRDHGLQGLGAQRHQVRPIAEADTR